MLLPTILYTEGSWYTVCYSFCCCKGWGFPCPHHEASGGSEAPFISPGSTRRKMGSFTSRPLYLQHQSPRYAWKKRLGGPQQSVWMLWSREKSLLPCRESKSYSSALDGVKAKVTLCKQRWGGIIALNESQLGTRRVVSTTPRLFYPGNDQVPTVQEAGWDSGTVWKISPSPGFHYRTVQQVGLHKARVSISRWLSNQET